MEKSEAQAHIDGLKHPVQFASGYDAMEHLIKTVQALRVLNQDAPAVSIEETTETKPETTPADPPPPGGEIPEAQKPATVERWVAE